METLIYCTVDSSGEFAEGVPFASTGSYAWLKGRVRFRLDPNAHHNIAITDVGFAPRDRDGLVTFESDFYIVKPRDMTRSNRRLFFDYGNRGNKRALQFFNDAVPSNLPRSAEHAGNGFLFRQGYSVVWLGWQGDLYPGDNRLVLNVPVASDGDIPIKGLVRSEFIVDRHGVQSLPLSGRLAAVPYPTANRDTRHAVLTMREYAREPRIVIPPDAWEFARIDGGEGQDNQGRHIAIVDSDRHIYLRDGFRPGWIYELVYEGHSPRVLGLGHAAVRDFLSFLRHATHDADGVVSPLGDSQAIDKVYGWGRSQTGRCLRDFVYQGFNADSEGRRVFDGIMPHVAGAGRMWINQRFANTIGAGGQQHEEHFNPADQFPFAYAMSTDHLSAKRDAILKRPDTDPHVIHTQTSTEYWQRRGSLVHTDTEGNDLATPDNVRIYLWSSSQHFADPNLETPPRGVCEHHHNPLWTSLFFRAHLVCLDRWVTDGEPPPPSQIPRRADNTLVDYETWRASFPDIPGALVPHEPNQLGRMDFGARAEEGIHDTEPPLFADTRSYVVMIPAVDNDGNEIAGVRSPLLIHPLGTFAGWNIRSRGQGRGAMHEFSGSYLPFARSAAEQRMTNDPRPSIDARYADSARYVELVESSTRTLVELRHALAEDVARAADRAMHFGGTRYLMTET